MSKKVIVGTAGHIDHGKSALVHALTGIDPDRLKEEKERGITIELGFAHLLLPSGTLAGIIDVPGHEKFVRTMVAGAAGIDIVMLVVAADEGVMPQTREHLDICRLLAVRDGLVALTKCDKVTATTLPGLLARVATQLAKHTAAHPDLLPTSARLETGIAEVRAELAHLSQWQAEAAEPSCG